MLGNQRIVPLDFDIQIVLQRHLNSLREGDFFAGSGRRILGLKCANSDKNQWMKDSGQLHEGARLEHLIKFVKSSSPIMTPHCC